jgi:hypothetical protein
MITWSAHRPTLKVNKYGLAVVSWTNASGRRKHTLAWGAVNARTPSSEVPQVRFKLDYSGGWGSFGGGYWRRVRNACTRYTGPPLSHLVYACDARDGSYWALQTWRREELDGGWTGRPRQQAAELHLSHWRGSLPVLHVRMDWAYRRYDRLFGYLSYRSSRVYGFSATGRGNPLDTYGRNVYVDVHDPPWGSGWYRFNSGLTHNPDGNFCIGMYTLYGRTQPAKGDEYRATVMGPGVTPIVEWKGAAPGPYNALVQAEDSTYEHSFITDASDSCLATS